MKENAHNPLGLGRKVSGEKGRFIHVPDMKAFGALVLFILLLIMAFMGGVAWTTWNL
jgi:hypothetical protein